MNKETITETENEVKRFLKRLEALKATDEYKAESTKYSSISGCTESGALKRASMDLTRSLAKLRKY
jgi:hypothetical protein